MQQHFARHSIDIIAALLTTGPGFERPENNSTRSCGGKQEWRFQSSIAAAVGSQVSERDRGPRATLTASRRNVTRDP